MTFLTAKYRRFPPISTKDYARMGRLSTVYGLRTWRYEGEFLVVEYDASRLRAAEVLAQLRRAGIDVQPEEEIAPGALDGSGEFKDWAWPTSGLSPVNQKFR